MSGYAYYSGVRFSVYAAGSTDALLRGGRYDEVGAVFGRNRPAVGFSLDLRQLSAAMPAAPLRAAIRAPWSEDAGLRAAIRALRADNETVVCALPGHDHETQEFACDRELVAVDNQWTLRSLTRRLKPPPPTHHPAVAGRRILFFLNPDPMQQGNTSIPLARPQRRRRRHPMGRRRQGQGRRLADRPRAGRRPLPGRPQRGPHAGHQGRQDRAAADPVGRDARRRQLLHRQRRGGRSDPPAVRDRAPREDRPGRALAPVRERGLPADHAVPRGRRQGA